MAKDLDIALFGATGFTGGLVAEYLARAAQQRPLRWALAGRNRHKLEAVKRALAAAHPALGELELVLADSGDESSLRALAERAHVIITTVGPYAKYGEPLVKACAEVGADYVDLTGEPAFVDAMIDRYHTRAEQRGVKIVHACGFDSIPHDLGSYFTLKALRAALSEPERASAAVQIEGIVRMSAQFSGGTWHSAVHAMAGLRAYERERRRRAALLPSGGPRGAHGARQALHYHKELGLWLLPMPTIDPLVVLRSGRTLPEYGPDFRYGHYLGLAHAYQALGLLIGVGTIFALAQFRATRALLLKLREPGQGPDASARERSWFKVTFLGRAGQHRAHCEVRGGDPGYGETAKMLAESALCLAFDRARLPAHYGVVTSAAAMGDALIERLTAAGIAFDVITQS